MANPSQFPIVVLDANRPAVNIGSQTDNDIVLTGLRPFHASLILLNNECQVMPLDSEASIRLDNEPIKGPYPIPLDGAAHQLILGSHTFRLEFDEATRTLHLFFSQPMAATEQQLSPTIANETGPTENRTFRLNVGSKIFDIEAGDTATYALDITNLGPKVAEFNIALEGAPQEWVSITPTSINVNPKDTGHTNIHIKTIRSPECSAGQHNLRIVVFSSTYQEQHHEIIPLHIKPFYDFSLGNLSPRDQKIKNNQTGITILPITNQGNSAGNFTLSAFDEENGCSFDFVMEDDLRITKQATVNIPAGETRNQPIEIRPHKPNESFKRFSFTTTAQIENQTSLAPRSTSGTAVVDNRNGIGCLLGALIFMLMLCCLSVSIPCRLFFIETCSLSVTKETIIINERTTLEKFVTWPPFASSRLVDLSSPENETPLEISPKKSTTYELVVNTWASNFLKDLAWRKQRTVIVVPPMPEISQFTVDDKEITLDEKTTSVTWVTSNADNISLIINGAETKLEASSGTITGEALSALKLRKDSLIVLKAQNLNGDTAISSQFVRVKQPQITIKKFIIWIKPDDKTNAPTPSATPASNQGDTLAQTGSQSAAKAEPTPASGGGAQLKETFTEKYVEIVCNGPWNDQQEPKCTTAFGPITVSKPMLNRKESILVEWELDGADTLDIKPIGEKLIAAGERLYSPDETTVFELSAISGGIKANAALTVNVDSTSEPEPPVIEIFQAVPNSLTNAGTIELSWAISGASDRREITYGGLKTPISVDPEGFRKEQLSDSRTYILTAWNGDLKTSKSLTVEVKRLQPIDIEIEKVVPDKEKSYRYLVGDKVVVWIKQPQVPDNLPAPTGKITITDGFSSCAMELPTISCELTLKNPGKQKVWANYAGDSIYSQAASGKFPKGSNSFLIVSTQSVEMSYAYYEVDPLTGEKSSNQINITGQALKINQKIAIDITITPAGGGNLIEDDYSQITLQVCYQSSPDDCTSRLSGQVEVKDNVGTAEIVVNGFPGAGTFMFIYEYRHTQGSIATKTESVKNIKVEPTDIYLTLPPSPECANDIPDVSGTNAPVCNVSYADASKTPVVFFIRQTDGHDYLEKNVMPQPSQTWTVYEVAAPGQTGLSSKGDLSCKVSTRTIIEVKLGSSVSRTVYVLECQANMSGKAQFFVNYSFDNQESTDYFMGDDDTSTYTRNSFTLRPINQTAIQFDKSEYKVGEIIKLTPNGALSLENPNTGNLITKSNGLLTFTATSADSGNLLDVTPNSTCQANVTGTAIINIDIDETCEIFFRKKGSWNIYAAFAGDNNYGASNRTIKDVRVFQQNQIVAKWYYTEDANWEKITDWASLIQTPKTIIYGKVVFKGPENFSPKVLSGSPIFTTFTPGSSQKCKGEFSPDITYATASNEATFSFTLTCEDEIPVKVDVDIAFSPALQENFKFISVSTSRQAMFIGSKGTGMGSVYFELVPAKGAPIDPNIFEWPTPPGLIPLIYSGRSYKVHLMYKPIYKVCPPNTKSCWTAADEAYVHKKGTGILRSVRIKFPTSWIDKISNVFDINTCYLNANKTELIVPLVGRRTYIEDPALPTGTHITELSSPKMKLDGDQSTKPSYVFNDNDPSAPPCVLNFSIPINDPSITLPLGANQSTSFLLDEDFKYPLDNTGVMYSAGENYALEGIDKALIIVKNKTVTKPTSIKTVVTVELGSQPASGYTIAPKISDFNISYPSTCMDLETIINGSIVTWNLTSKGIYPCSGTFSIFYKENILFKTSPILNIPVSFQETTPSPTPAPTATP